MSAANGQLQDPARLGTAIRSIGMSLRGASIADLQNAGIDVEGMTGRKDIGKILKSIAGVDIKKNAETNKDVYTILDELADKWGGLSDVAQSALATQIAGKTQGNAFMALLNNWDDVRAAYKTAQNSQGSATRENAAYMDSVQAKYNQVQASFEDLSRSFVTSGLLKTGAGSLNSILQGVNGFVKTFGAGGSIAAFLGGRDLLKSTLTGDGISSLLARAALRGDYDPSDRLSNIEGMANWAKNGIASIGESAMNRIKSRGASTVAEQVAKQARTMGADVTDEAIGAIAKDAMIRARKSGLSGKQAESAAKITTLGAVRQGQASQGSNPYTLSNGNELAVNATGEAVNAATGAASALSKVLGVIGIVAAIGTAAYVGFKALDKAVGLTKGQSIKNMQSSLTAYQNAQEAVTQTQGKIEKNTSERKDLLNKQNKTLDDQARLQELNTEDQTYTLKQQSQEAEAAQKRQAAAKKVTHAVNKYRGNREDVTTADVNRAASAYGKRMQTSDDYNSQQQALTNYDNIVQGNDILDQLAQLSYWSGIEKSGKSSASQKKSATKNKKSLQSGLNKTLGQYTKFLSAYQQIGYNNLTKGQQNTYDELFKDSDVIQRAMAQSNGNMAQYYSQRAKNVVTDLMSRYSDDITKQMQKTDRNFSLGDYADNPLGLLAKVGENQKGGKFDVNALTGVFAKIRSQLKDSGFTKDDFDAFNSSVNELISQTTGTGANSQNGIESNYDTVLSEAKKYQDQLAQIQANYKQAFSAPGMNFEQATSMTAMGFGAALERTAGGIRLNTREYEKLNQAMHQSQISKVSDELDDAYDDFNKIGGKINEIQGKVARGTATKDEMDQLAEYREQYQEAAQNIENLRNRRSAIEGSDSAVTRFVNSGSQGDVGDVLDATAQQITNTKKDYDQGKTSSKQVRDFVGMLTYGDTSNLTNSQVAQAYSGAMQRAQLVGSIDKNGNFNYSADKIIGIASDFQSEVQKAGNSGYKLIDTVNKTINGTTQDVEAIAKKENVSKDFVQEWFNWLGERGWDINIDDSQRKDLSQRLNDADEQVKQINQNGAKDKYYGGKNAPSQEDLDNTVQSAKNAVNNGNESAYNKTMDTLNQQIDETNAAIDKAGAAGDKEARNAYGDKLAQQLQARETADSYDHNKIMQTNASTYQGATSDLVTAMQGYQEAQDQLDVGNQMSARGFQTDIDNLQGKVKDASEQMRTAFQGIFDEGTNKELIGKLNQLGITGGNALAQQIQAALINPDGSLNTGNWNAIKLALQPENKGLTGPEETPNTQNQSNTKPSDKGRAGQESTESKTNQERAKEWDERERRNYNARKDRGNGLSGGEESEQEVNRARARNWNEKEQPKYNQRRNGAGLTGGESAASKTNEERAREWDEQERQKYNQRRNGAGLAGPENIRSDDLIAAVREATTATKEGTAATKEGTATTKGQNGPKNMPWNQSTQNSLTNSQVNGRSTGIAGFFSGVGNWFSSLFGLTAQAGTQGATVNSTLGRGLLGYSYPQTYTAQQLYQQQHPSVLWANQYGQNNPAPTVQSSTDLTSAVKQNTQATKEGTQTTKQTTVQKQVQSVQQQTGRIATAIGGATPLQSGWAAQNPLSIRQTPQGSLGSLNLPGLNGQSAKIKVDADTTQAEEKTKNVGKNSNAKVKLDADTTNAEQKAKNVGKGANPKVKVQGDVSDVTKKISSIKAQPIKVKLAVDPTTGTKTNLPNYGGRYALANPNQYSGGSSVAQKVSSSGSSSKQKLTGTVEYTAKFKDKKAPPLTGVAIYISQFPTKKAPPLSGTATYSAKFPTKSAPPLTGTVTYTATFVDGVPTGGGGGGKKSGGGKKGSHKLKGTAHSQGTVSGFAHANGVPSRYTVGRDEESLINEVGPELIVRGDRFFIANNGLPGFTNLRANDIVFDSEQTKQLLQTGTTSRYAGFANANGTVSGKAFASGKKSSSKKSSSSSSKSSSSSSGDDSENTQDWMEVYLKRIEAEISKLDITASSGFKTAQTRMDAYAQEVQKSTEELSKYSQISQKYLDKANAVGLSDAYKQKVQNGDISLENIADEGTRKKISSYTQWYEKYLDALTKEESLKEQILDLEYKASQVRLDYLSEDQKDEEVRIDQLTKYTNFGKNIGDVSPEWTQKFFENYANDAQKLLQRDVETQAKMAGLTPGTDKWREQERAQQEIKQQREELPSTEAEKLVSTFDTIITALKNSLPDYSNTKYFDPKTGDMSGLAELQKGLASNASKIASKYSQEAAMLQQIYSEIPDDRKNSGIGLAVWNMLQDALKSARNAFQDMESEIDTHFSNISNYLAKLQETTTKLSVVIQGTSVVGGQPTNSNLDSYLQNSRSWRNSKIAALNENIKKGLVTIGGDEYNKALVDLMQSHLDDASQVESTFNSIESYYDTAKQKLQLLNDEVAKYNRLTADSGKSIKQSSLSSLMANTGKVLSNEIQRYQDVQETINTGLRNGTIHVGDETYEALKNQQGDLRKNLETAINDTQSEIENMFDAIESRLSSTNDIIQQYINNAQESGHDVGASFYNALIENAQQSIGLEQQKKDSLEQNLIQGLQSGAFQVGSTDWYNLKKQIDACDKSIAEAQGSIIKYNNSLKELKWDAVEKVNDRFDDQIKELSFLSGLIDDSDMWDKDNQITDSYLGKLGLMASEYDADFKAAQTLDGAIEDLQEQIAADPSNNTLHEKLDSFLGKKQNYITAAHSLRKEIVQLAQTNLSKLQNQLNKLISNYEKLLDAEKDQMDYQRSITQAQESVDTYQKQVMSYTGDTSEEGRAKLQKAQKNLKDAQDDLREKQEDKRISDIKALLAELEDQFSTAIDNYMKDAEQVFVDQIALVNANQDTVKAEIRQTALDNGYTVSQATEQLLAPAVGTQTMVTEFRGDFMDQSAQALMSVNNIESTIQSYMQQADQAAQAQLEQLKQMQSAYDQQEAAAEQQGQQMLQAVLRAAAAAEAAAAAIGQSVQDDAITDEQGTLDTANGGTKKKNTFYQRYYNKKTGQHVTLGNQDEITKDLAAKNDDGTSVWQADGNSGIYSADGQEGAIKVTRLYNPKYGHIFTTNQTEIEALQSQGYKIDGAMWGVSKDKGVPVYRFYNTGDGTHFFTTDNNEKDSLLKTKGWNYEGIAWYAPSGSYATGTRRNPKKGNYWTQENGKPEAIIRQSDGAILTPLNQGDSVLNGKATQRLYDMANNPSAFFRGHSTIETDIPRTTVNNDIEVNINLPNVQNADQFVRELQTNPKIEKLIQEMTLGQLNGNNTLKKRGIRI